MKCPSCGDTIHGGIIPDLVGVEEELEGRLHHREPLREQGRQEVRDEVRRVLAFQNGLLDRGYEPDLNVKMIIKNLTRIASPPAEPATTPPPGTEDQHRPDP